MKNLYNSANRVLILSVIALIPFLASCDSKVKVVEEVAKVSPYKEFHVEVNDLTIYMKQWSFQGPPVIFLIGGGEDMGSWGLREIRILDTKYRPLQVHQERCI